MEFRSRKVLAGCADFTLTNRVRSLAMVRAFVLVLVFLLCASTLSYAQNANEILRQNSTQQKYLLKQLAYLKLYAGQLKEGYDLVGEGLNTIKGFTEDEFSLHEAFFGSLSVVKPFIKADKRVLEIAQMQLQIGMLFSAMLSTALEVQNLEYVRLVRQGVELECEKDLKELLLVISASSLELSDEQRLSRLAKVHSTMGEKLAFSHSFYVQLQQLVQNKKKQKQGLEWLRRLYERD